MLLPIEMVARMRNRSMCQSFFSPKGEALSRDHLSLLTVVHNEI